jgi:hypothetical protein
MTGDWLTLQPYPFISREEPEAGAACCSAEQPPTHSPVSTADGVPAVKRWLPSSVVARRSISCARRACRPSMLQSSEPRSRTHVDGLYGAAGAG